jgi:hypothetical protein
MRQFFCLLAILTILSVNLHAQDVKLINRYDSVKFYERVNCTYEDSVPSSFWIDKDRKEIFYFDEKDQCTVYKYSKAVHYERFTVYIISNADISSVKIMNDQSMVVLIKKDNRTIFYNN